MTGLRCRSMSRSLGCSTAGRLSSADREPELPQCFSPSCCTSHCSSSPSRTYRRCARQDASAIKRRTARPRSQSGWADTTTSPWQSHEAHTPRSRCPRSLRLTPSRRCGSRAAPAPGGSVKCQTLPRTFDAFRRRVVACCTWFPGRLSPTRHNPARWGQKSKARWTARGQRAPA